MSSFSFPISAFHRNWRLTEQQGKGPSFFLVNHFQTSQAFCVRWLLDIFNWNTCIYQTDTWWYLPPYRITIWLIDDVMWTFLCLHHDLILGFCYKNLTRDLSTKIRIDYHPCITTETINQVCYLTWLVTIWVNDFFRSVV